MSDEVSHHLTLSAATEEIARGMQRRKLAPASTCATIIAAHERKYGLFKGWTADLSSSAAGAERMSTFGFVTREALVAALRGVGITMIEEV